MIKDLLKYFKGDDLASNVWQSKYAAEGEETPEEMHRRMAKEFTKADKIYTQPSTDETDSEFYLKTINEGLLSNYGSNREDLTEESIFNLFKDFKYIVPQGSIMATLGTDIIASLSNCWVNESPYDSYAGILKSDSELAYYYKRRGGVGQDISNLRPSGTNTNNTAKSTTGAVSFMHRFSNTTREVAMNGRRGALMISISINHPDVMDFIKVKRDGTSVTGANISVRLNNEFMKAVENDEDYILRFPCESNIGVGLQDAFSDNYNELVQRDAYYTKRIKAKEYWEEIVHSAKNYAEPGVLYWDNALDFDPATVYDKYKPICTNPCVIGETEILTKEGYKEIAKIVDKEVEIWNGYEWSKVTPKITGYDQKILNVELSDGRNVSVTDYHKWILKGGERVETKNLVIGDKIEKYKFPILKDFPGVHVDKKKAYTQGFISADGQDNYNHLWLYEPKYLCKERLTVKSSNEFDKRKQVFLSEEYESKTFIPFEWNIASKVEWLSGLFDGDGTELKNGGLQLWSIDYTFLKELQKFISLLGVNSKVLKGKEKTLKEMPDGKGGTALYNCAECFRICLGAVEMQELKSLGLNCSRMSFNKKPNRSAQRFVTITKITRFENADKVYCFNEPINHSGVFNGILTAQCGEQFLNANDSCRLMVLNLFSFVDNPFTKNAKIDYKKLYEVAYEHCRLGDGLVDLELEYIERIIDKIKLDPEPEEVKQGELNLWLKSHANTKAGRRIGLGITALADMLAAVGISYDSKDGLSTVEKVMRTKMEAELDCSIDLSILRGAFDGWDAKKEFQTYNSVPYGGANKFYQFILDEFPEQAARMVKYGRRNVSLSTIAPAGSTSLLTQTSSGCEPLFMPFYTRRKKINPSDKSARVDFVDEIGDSWEEFAVLHPKFREWIEINFIDVIDDAPTDVSKLTKERLQELFEESPWFNSTANDIDWIKRVEIQSILQKYTTNAISSTINLPSTVTEEQVSEIYMHGWKTGLKGQTVYVDGSRSGVMISEKKEELVKFHENHAPKRPKKLLAKVVKFNNNYEKWVAFVGLMDGKPYEIFTGKLENVSIPTNVEEGEIIKVNEDGVKRYDFIHKEGVVKSISNVFSADYWNYGKLISGMLRHGMPLNFVVATIQELNWGEEHINTWKNGIARALKKFIKDGVVEGAKCSDCNSTNIVFEEGCMSCKDCGSSKCG